MALTDVEWNKLMSRLQERTNVTHVDISPITVQIGHFQELCTCRSGSQWLSFYCHGHAIRYSCQRLPTSSPLARETEPSQSWLDLQESTQRLEIAKRSNDANFDFITFIIIIIFSCLFLFCIQTYNNGKRSRSAKTLKFTCAVDDRHYWAAKW